MRSGESSLTRRNCRGARCGDSKARRVKNLVGRFGYEVTDRNSVVEFKRSGQEKTEQGRVRKRKVDDLEK